MRVQFKKAKKPVAPLESQPKKERTDPLSDPLRAKLEAGFGEDLSDVAVHQNSAEPGRHGAIAMATGNDIHFHGSVREDVLAHEVAHVVQQRRGQAGTATESALEGEADAAADAVMGGGRASIAPGEGGAAQPQFFRVQAGPKKSKRLGGGYTIDTTIDNVEEMETFVAENNSNESALAAVKQGIIEAEDGSMALEFNALVDDWGLEISKIKLKGNADDPDLMKAMGQNKGTAAQQMEQLLKDVASGKIDKNDFSKKWRGSANPKLKRAARAKMAGQHEWLPTSELDVVAANGTEWVDMYYDVRTPTSDLIFDPAKVMGSLDGKAVLSGHSGAIYVGGKPSTYKQPAFHDACRAALTAGQVSKAVPYLKKVASDWIWDGTTKPGTAPQAPMDVRGFGTVNDLSSLGKLAAHQAGKYKKMMDSFAGWEKWATQVDS